MRAGFFRRLYADLGDGHAHASFTESEANLPTERKLAHRTAKETAIRKAYQLAEEKDIAGWVNSFTARGTFTDQSIG